jgi:soluble cytochrome b562
MSDEQTPSVDDLKEQEKLGSERIVIEEDEVKNASPKMDIAAEFQKLGRQFAETLQTAWDSEERKRVEKEVREGMQSFVNEVDQVIREVKASDKTEKIKSEAEELKTRVESTDIAARARQGFVQGLRWLSEGLGELANQFTPPAKGEDVAEESDSTEA